MQNVLEIPVVREACTTCLRPRFVKLDDTHSIVVGCGHCVPCRIKKTKEWSLRLEMESKDYNFNDIQFVTLTYKNEKLPCACSLDGSEFAITLYKPDLQKFIKRLRKRLDYPIRYFAVGEYGVRTLRPHYHLIIFGLKSKDAYLVKQCWKDDEFGFSLCKPFFNETTYYIAGYVQKKLFSKKDYGVATPPFLLCSQGLGLNYIFRPDVLANIQQDPDNCIYVNGFKRALPRYFRKKLENAGLICPLSYDDIVHMQLEQSIGLMEHLGEIDCSLEDYKNLCVAEARRKDIKSNRTRNSNFNV